MGISESEKKGAQARGGKGDRKLILDPLPPIQLKTRADVLALQTDIINQLRAGKMDDKNSQTLQKLALDALNTIRSIENQEDLERLKAEDNKRRAEMEGGRV